MNTADTFAESKLLIKSRIHRKREHNNKNTIGCCRGDCTYLHSDPVDPNLHCESDPF